MIMLFCPFIVGNTAAAGPADEKNQIRGVDAARGVHARAVVKWDAGEPCFRFSENPLFCDAIPKCVSTGDAKSQSAAVSKLMGDPAPPTIPHLSVGQWLNSREPCNRRDLRENRALLRGASLSAWLRCVCADIFVCTALHGTDDTLVPAMPRLRDPQRPPLRRTRPLPRSVTPRGNSPGVVSRHTQPLRVVLRRVCGCEVWKRGFNGGRAQPQAAIGTTGPAAAV